MYVSHLITEDIIDTWCGNDRIFRKSPCGTGKTKFITDTFYTYAKQRSKKILILNSRRLLETTDGKGM